MRLRLCLLIALLPSSGLAADLVFSGSLLRVGQESISIKLADRRVIDARFEAKSSAQYSLGDLVRITCKQIQRVWEESTSRYQSLEVTELQLVRRMPPEETPKAAARRATFEGPEATRSKLEHAREVNLAYVANMPNFVADETAKRWSGDRYMDTIETEVTFRGNRAIRQQIRRNGKAWKEPFEALPGFKWSGGFGSEIKPLFDPNCPTTIEYEGSEERRGRQVTEYRFRSPADGCFVPFYMEYQQYNPARNGHVFVDESSGNVIELEEKASGFPPDFRFTEREEHVSWDYVKIGEATHLLPVSATFVVAYSSGARSRVEVKFTNHRHFEAASDFTFH